MQINRTSPAVGFIIISHFNEVATDIKTTRSLRVMFRRRPATRWLRREPLERRSNLPRSARRTPAESTGRTQPDERSESGKGNEEPCGKKEQGDRKKNVSGSSTERKQVRATLIGLISQHMGASLKASITTW